jgi:TRAP-type uncharacterized transport system fused permease subunit
VVKRRTRRLLGIDGYYWYAGWRFVTTALGIVAVNIACVGWLLRPLGVHERIWYFGVACVFVFPSAMMDTLGFVGFVGLGVALLWIWATRHGAVRGITEEQSVDNPK